MHYHRGIYSLMAIGAMFGMQGCVDHDYDLSQDIDMTMEFGGNLTLPPSSVAPYSMKKIMNLPDDGSSSIRPDGALYGLSAGDYVLVQSGSGSSTTFSVDEVVITNLSAAGANQSIPVNFTVPAGVTLPTFSILIGGNATSSGLVQKIDAIENTVHMSESGVNRDLVSLNRIGTDIRGVFNMWVGMNNSRIDAKIKRGFRVSFDPSLSLEVVSANVDCAFEGSDLVFNADATVSSLDLVIRITGMDCSRLPSGQGLVDHNFIFDGKVTTTGEIEVSGVSVPAGDVSFNINTSFSLSSAVIKSIEGVVNPTVTIDNTSFAINDIPDFLNDGSSNLDIDNPQIYLTVDNSSEVSADINVTLRSVSNENGLLASVNVGGIRVVPGHNVICISRTGQGNRNDITGNVTSSDLTNLISTIPDYIEVADCQVAVVQQPVEFVLGRDYSFTTANEVIAPLAFGPALTFTYSDKEEGWDEDLEDYNFKRVIISAQTTNTIPLSMTPSVRAIFKDDPNGDRSRDIRVNVTGNIAAGTLSSPSQSSFTVELVSEVANLAGLDGIEYTFAADSPIVGQPLNESQALTISKLSVTIAGGIIVDLND
ncbi:hypothetical protein [Muribaculum intestinale]|uniref:hypothetical protein n=1 Tax=Muribaculum intestinale TaxID=1796646 RepID=UPI00243282B6|nr:hypothetical protein [Muribaculum intestinale]